MSKPFDFGRVHLSAGEDAPRVLTAEIPFCIAILGDFSDGESESKPCSEVLLTEDAAERMLDEGRMPLVSFEGRERVRIGQISVDCPPAAWAGRAVGQLNPARQQNNAAQVQLSNMLAQGTISSTEADWKISEPRLSPQQKAPTRGKPAPFSRRS
jgi:hypothetical protein